MSYKYLLSDDMITDERLESIKRNKNYVFRFKSIKGSLTKIMLSRISTYTSLFTDIQLGFGCAHYNVQYSKSNQRHPKSLSVKQSFGLYSLVNGILQSIPNALSEFS